jgi:hypothetical protein
VVAWQKKDCVEAVSEMFTSDANLGYKKYYASCKGINCLSLIYFRRPKL